MSRETPSRPEAEVAIRAATLGVADVGDIVAAGVAWRNGQHPAASVNDALFAKLSEPEKAVALAHVAQRPPANGHGPAAVSATAALASGVFIPQPKPLADLLDKKFAPLAFLVTSILARGHLAVLGGRPKSGKSWLALQLARAVDLGEMFLGQTTQQARVLYIALEDGERRVYQRSQVLKWQPKAAAVLFDIARFDGDGTVGPGVAQVAHLANNYDLVIVDTLIATLSGRANENDNAAMGAIVNELARVAHETDTAILLVHHTGKGAAENVFDLLRGASAIRGGYDVGMILERKQDEREAVLHMESRDVDLSSMTIRQADNGAGWESLGTGAEIKTIRAGRRIVETIQEHGEGLTAEELATAANITRQAAQKQLNVAEGHRLVRREKMRRGGASKPVDLWYIAN